MTASSEPRPPTAEEVGRYDLVAHFRGMETWHTVEPDPEGDLVQWQEYATLDTFATAETERADAAEARLAEYGRDIAEMRNIAFLQGLEDRKDGRKCRSCRATSDPKGWVCMLCFQARLDGHREECVALRAEIELLREAAIQARGALRIDVMLDDDGQPYGTTIAAMNALNEALNDDHQR